MGFGDKLKGLREQAQQAVAENKDRIQGAVQVVGEAANTKTGGKYATKIAKVGDKVEQSVDKFAQSDNTDAAAAPIVNEPANPVSPSMADEAAGGFPTASDEATEPAERPAPSAPPEFE
jgi:hypothetical protein